MEFKTERGVVLALQPVSTDAVHSYVGRLGMDAEGKIAQLSGEANAISNDFLNYVFGWGITNDPPEDELAELLLIDSTLNSGMKRLVRASWVRKMVLTSQQEAAALLAKILEVSA